MEIEYLCWGFVAELTIVLVILKALGYLSWKWLVVFLPVLVPIAFVTLLVFFGFLVLLANIFVTRLKK